MGNITPIRAVKPVFSAELALRAALNFGAETSSKMAIAIVAALVLRTDDRSVVRMTYRELAHLLRVGARCVEIHCAQLIEAGFLNRPDPKVPFEYSWNVDGLIALAEAERASVAKISLFITTLSWASPDEQETLAALSDGYARGFARREHRQGREAVKWSPELPRNPETCRRMIAKVQRFALSAGRDICEAARYCGDAYTYDEGAWTKTNGPPPWTWFEHATMVEGKALELMRRARDRREKKREERRAAASPATKKPDPLEYAAQAASAARAAGMGGAR